MVSAGTRELIRMANACDFHLHKHFSSPRTLKVDGCNFQWLACGIADCSFRFHPVDSLHFAASKPPGGSYLR
jgi:hypothetical protein